jgi:hypothetical protein
VFCWRPDFDSAPRLPHIVCVCVLCCVFFNSNQTSQISPIPTGIFGNRKFIVAHFNSCCSRTWQKKRNKKIDWCFCHPAPLRKCPKFASRTENPCPPIGWIATTMKSMRWW